MEHHLSPFGELVNRLLGPLVLPLLEALGYHPHNRAEPIPDHIATQLLIALFAVVFTLWFRRRLSAENPGGLQLCLEQALSNSFRVGFHDLLDGIVGHGGRKYLAFVGTVGLFVLLCNAISLIPLFTSPTAVHTVPLGCALSVFLYYHVAGIRAHGPIGYGKHFMGPVPLLAILMVPIELISHTARLLSLTVRLFVNMTVSEFLYVQFLNLGVLLVVGLWKINALLGIVSAVVPLVFPPLFVGLHIFVAFIQALVFTILPVVYISGAVAHEH